MHGATVDGEMVTAPAGGDGFARRRLALLGAIAVVLFAVAFGVGSMVKSHTAQQVPAASLVPTTPLAGTPHLTIVKVQAATVPGLRAPVHKAVKVTSSSTTTPGGQSSVASTTTPGGQSSVASTTAAAATSTPQVTAPPPVPTVTAPSPQTHTTQQQTSTSGGLVGGSS